MKNTKDMLFSELLNEWLSSKALEIEKTTLSDYTRDAKYLSIYFVGKKVSEITVKEIRDFYTSEINKGLSANTVKHRHSIIFPALNFALKELRIIDFNPATAVKLPKVRKYVHHVINTDIIKQILEDQRDTPMELPIFMAAIYGLRRSEIIGMKWTAFDFKNKVFTMQNTVVRKKINDTIERLERSYGKNNSSYRQFPIIDELEDLLNRIKKNHEIYKKNIPYYTTQDEEYLCLNEEGRVLLPEFLTRKFKKIIKKLGLNNNIRFHDLRHSCATFLYNLGIEAKDMQLWLGHSDISTTLNIYTHLNFRNKERTANKLKSVFEKK